MAKIDLILEREIFLLHWNIMLSLPAVVDCRGPVMC